MDNFSMPYYQEITSPKCGSNHLIKAGKSDLGIQRYCCQNQDCSTRTFMLEYRYKAYKPEIEEKIIDMAINSSGIRDTARVLKINKNTVLNTLKSKEDMLVQVNPIFQTMDCNFSLSTGTFIFNKLQ